MFNKALNIRGQGISATTVTSTSGNTFDVVTSNIRLSDMTIINTGSSGSAIATSHNLNSLLFKNLYINSTDGGVKYGIYVSGSSGTIENVKINVFSICFS